MSEYEKRIAIFEGFLNKCSDGYFDVRPQIDSVDRRNVFKAGFERAWELLNPEADQLRAQLAEQAKQMAVMREALKELMDSYEGRMGEWENADFNECYVKAQQALATPDTSGLVVCKDEVVAVVEGDGMPHGRVGYMRPDTKLYAPLKD